MRRLHSTTRSVINSTCARVSGTYITPTRDARTRMTTELAAAPTAAPATADATPAAADATPAATSAATPTPEEPEAPAPAVPAPAAPPPTAVPADGVMAMQTPSAEAEPALRNGGGSVHRGSAQRDRGVRRASLLDHARPNAPPLAKLRRSLTSDRSASFGSIRFPARTMPAKFVHLAPDSDARVVVRLLVDTWKLANPCAVLALSPPSAGPMAPMTPMAPANKADEVNSRLMLRSKLTPDEVNIKLRSGWAEHVKSAVLEVPQLATTIIGTPGLTP